MKNFQNQEKKAVEGLAPVHLVFYGAFSNKMKKVVRNRTLSLSLLHFFRWFHGPPTTDSWLVSELNLDLF